MSEVWLTVLLVAVAGAAIKAAGPLIVGEHPLPDWAPRVISLLVPALLTALVIVGTVSEGQRLVVDARLAGVAAGGAALLLRASLVVALVVAAAVTALVRALW